MADVQKALARAEELSKAAAQIAGAPQSPKHSQMHVEGQGAEPSDRSTDVDQVAGTHVVDGKGKKKKDKKDAEKGRAAQIADLAKAAAALAETEETEEEVDAAAETETETETETTNETAALDGEAEIDAAPDAGAEVERSLRGHPDVQKTVDVSLWVAGITDQLDAALNTFDATLSKSLQVGAAQTQAIAALAAQIAEENAELHGVVKGLVERIERLERQPQDRKGITKGGVGGVQIPGGAPTREQILGRMSALAEKGMLSAMDIAAFESGGQFTLRARDLIERGAQ